MEIEEMLPLGPQRALYVVRVGTRRLVVGATAQAIHLLTEWDEGEEDGSPLRRQPSAGAGGFAAALRARVDEGVGRREEGFAEKSGELRE